MFHVFTRAACDYRPDLDIAFEQYVRLRHDVFVDMRKWEALRKPDRREIDEFDNDDTIYMIWMEGGKFLGGCRFMPTLGEHLLSAKFSYMVEQVLRGPAIYEGSRILVAPDAKGASRNAIRGFMVGLIAACEHLGIEGMTYIMDERLLSGSLSMGWEAQPIGPPATTTEGDVIIPVYAPVTPGLSQRLRNNMQWFDDLPIEYCLGKRHPMQKAA